MLRVKLRNDHRNVRCVTVCAVVGNNRALRLRVTLFERFNLIFFHIDRAENEVDHACNFLHVAGRVHDNHVFDVFRNVNVHAPFLADRFRIRFAGGTRACRNRRYMKPRVIGKERQKALTDHARSTDYTNIILFFHLCLPPKSVILLSA